MQRRKISWIGILLLVFPCLLLGENRLDQAALEQWRSQYRYGTVSAPISQATQPISLWWQYGAYLLLAGGMIGGIMWGWKRYRYTQKGTWTDASQAENLPLIRSRSSLLDTIQAARQATDLQAQIRGQFLLMLHDLETEGHISWQKGKTNQMYMDELTTHPVYNSISVLSGIFEQVVFGKANPAEWMSAWTMHWKIWEKGGIHDA